MQFHRRSVRIPGYDYKRPGYYFLTINSVDGLQIFGNLEDKTFHPFHIGDVILKC